MPESCVLVGVDIGGTKCAVCIGRMQGPGVTIVGKRRFATPKTPTEALAHMMESLDSLAADHAVTELDAIGISCGGPLDSREGLILSPPNLPGWDHIDVVTPFRTQFNAPTALQNDANACALAEWRWGAGQGCRNMLFLTFGTGMGAGLILDGRLYSGANDLAGEVGHVRLADDGPLGYGKAGSFEGFCSGGGIAHQARAVAEREIARGRAPSYCPTLAHLPDVTAETVGKAARSGDPAALEVFDTAARYLGRGLAMLIDILNPERIVIGSIYARQRSLLESRALSTMREEALSPALAVCQVAPASLGEQVGDLAGLSVAVSALADR